MDLLQKSVCVKHQIIARPDNAKTFYETKTGKKSYNEITEYVKCILAKWPKQTKIWNEKLTNVECWQRCVLENASSESEHWSMVILSNSMLSFTAPLQHVTKNSSSTATSSTLTIIIIIFYYKSTDLSDTLQKTCCCGTLQNYKSTMCLSILFSYRNDRWKKWVLVIRRKVSNESEFRISGGKLFQARTAAATENARSPSVVRRVDGSCSVRLSAARVRFIYAHRLSLQPPPTKRVIWWFRKIGEKAVADPEILERWRQCMNNFIRRKTVDVQHKQTAVQAIQKQTAIHEKKQAWQSSMLRIV